MATRKTHPRRTRRALSLERPAAPVRTVHARRTGHAPLEELITRLTKRFPDAQFRIDAPDIPDRGTSFLDVLLAGRAVSVEWSRARGFGITCRADVGYGERSDEAYETVEDAFERIVSLLLSGASTAQPGPVELADLRERRGLSQVDLAKQLKVQQGAISKLERRRDSRISTLRAYVEALGGMLEIRAHFKNGRVQPIRLASGSGRSGR